MFGFSFGEILVIAIIAVLFLGPDKLPQTFIDIAKFIKAIKKTINDAKDAIDREVHISEIKQEALEYKKKFEESTDKITKDIKENKALSELSDILNAPLDTPSYRSSVERHNVEQENSILKMEVKETTMQDLEERGKEIAINLKKKDKIDELDSNPITPPANSQATPPTCPIDSTKTEQSDACAEGEPHLTQTRPKREQSDA